MPCPTRARPTQCQDTAQVAQAMQQGQPPPATAARTLDLADQVSRQRELIEPMHGH
ncbi:hypothetical protein [Pseudomonas sp.]|uniref:hypothetical protein n=1 Tax=Pseudomonas sp. TaxID=306 RepID=UPI00272F84AA|nr:hypothetical protein [Pseudomonas sp.]MDP2242515.1 hypothetical protein [Pseudomonas sp.]